MKTRKFIGSVAVIAVLLCSVAGSADASLIRPVGDAKAETLARRLYFNLTGLPPAPEQLTAVEKDGIEQTTDLLLASPRFGEKWARHWLDLARYAESNGADRNVVFAHAWRYRNWVFDAFNRDTAYDRFVQLQLSGDISTPGATPEERAEGIIATGI